jgi:hypothetical protein
MNSNTYSGRAPSQASDGLGGLAAIADELAAQNLDRLTDAALADQVLVLRRLLDRLEGHWLQRVATVDARGAARAELGQDVGSTAAWLRSRLRLGAGAASSAVRTARALFRGPLTQTARALCDGELSAAHAAVVAHGTHQLPEHVTTEAELVLVEAARRLDPPRLRRVLGHLQLVADPDSADRARESRQLRWGLWLAATFDGMVAIDGYWNAKPARPCWRHWNRWLVQPAPRTPAAVANAARMPWPSWPAGPWKAGSCPNRAGSGPS